MKKWIKAATAFILTAFMMFGAVSCGKIETPQFIKQYLCVEHTYGTGEVIRWATCARKGKLKYTCTECGEVKYDVLTSTSHTPCTVEALEPTCAQVGYTEHTACAVCGTVLRGKTTIPKTSCLHENDYYAGAGLFACKLCGDKIAPNGEEVVTTQNFELDRVYRFYIPGKGAKAWITLTSSEANSYIAELELESGIVQEFFSVSIGFEYDENTKKIAIKGYVWVGDLCAATNEIPIVAEGVDYIDLSIESGTLGCIIDGESDDRLTLHFNNTPNDEVRAYEVVCKGGARIVLLSNDNE